MSDSQTGGTSMKLMVIDGNSILNRAFYGIKLLTTKDGLPTNAVYGFLNILLKLTDEDASPLTGRPPPSAIWPTRGTRPSARACPTSWPPSCR